MSKRSSFQRGARLWPLLLALPALIALLDVERCTSTAPPRPRELPRARDPVAPAPPAATARPGPRARPERPEPRAPAQTQATEQNRTCAPRALKACHDGDVWWFDACDQAVEQAEACDGRPCLGVSCAAVARRADACAGVPAYGTCSGDIASACVGGQVVSVDCAFKRDRCVMTREGARCMPRTPLDCSPSDAATCNGDLLRHCVDGSWESVNCAQRLGRCDAGGGRARCVATRAPSAAALALERCNAADDDLDGAIDEGTSCDKVALVAFVGGGVDAHALEARMPHELAVLNRVFHPLVFEWKKTVPNAAPQRFHPDAFDRLSAELARAEALDFYIPVLFVQTILTEPPKAGLSSLPNARCGGVRISDRASPAHGLVVVSDARQPETLAHEIGHYLGLCHTHDEITAYGLAGEPAAACEGTGDGICDTPWDPGPERCAVLDACGVQCAEAGAQPDPANVMSYYMPCRRGLSAQQLAEAERNLELRRGWFRCLRASDCPCAPGDPNACPIEMSCQPSPGDESAGRCLLDGPALPGAPCSDVTDCSGGAVCMGDGSGAARNPRCARACRRSAADCDCVDAGLPFRVCRQDLS